MGRFEKVELLMKKPTGKLHGFRWVPVTPTGRWRVVCVDGECTLFLEVSTVATTEHGVTKSLFGIKWRSSERRLKIVERFIDENHLAIKTYDQMARRKQIPTIQDINLILKRLGIQSAENGDHEMVIMIEIINELIRKIESLEWESVKQ